MLRKVMLLAVLLAFALAVAVPAIGPSGVEIAETAGLEITVDHELQPVQLASGEPPCPPSGGGGNSGC